MQTTAIRTVANSLPENKVILLTLLISKRYITYTDLRKKADSIPISRVKSHKKARGVPCGAALAGALLRQLVWRAIAFLRTFVQGESRSQVYLDYAEPPPKVHLYELSVVFPRILYARRAERQLQVVKKLSWLSSYVSAIICFAMSN